MPRIRVCLKKIFHTATILGFLWLVAFLKWAFIPNRTDQTEPSIEFPQQKSLYSSAHSKDERKISPFTEHLDERTNPQLKPLNKIEKYLQERINNIKQTCGDVCKTDQDILINGIT